MIFDHADRHPDNARVRLRAMILTTRIGPPTTRRYYILPGILRWPGLDRFNNHESQVHNDKDSVFSFGQ